MAKVKDRYRAVWVVELWTGERWESMSAVGLNRQDGRAELEVCREDLPDDKLRLVRYVPAKAKR